MRLKIISFWAVFFIIFLHAKAEERLWKWVCQEGDCVKTRFSSSEDAPLSLDACKMFCNKYGLLWPKPTGEVDLGNFLSKINLNNINVHILKHGKTSKLMESAGERFKIMVALAVPKGVTPKLSGKTLNVFFDNENPDIREFSLDMDERYALHVSPMSDDSLNATINANSYFGLRHGLETLAQLVVYDEIRDHLLIVRDVTITDEPTFPYRGLLVDTARNYIDIDTIKSTIEAMASVKLNTFHWHITDSQSFPFVSERRPNLSKFGAYSPRRVYTKGAIKEIVQYGLERGVRVLPEFDAPAHVGEGWQDTNLTVCFNAHPWRQYCVEPPCGQLNPTREEVYEYLEDIYKDMAEAFQPDMFHMGGDEVSEKCWKSSKEIEQFMIQNRWDSDASFLKLWNYFQTRAQAKAYKAFGKKLPLILWTSTLTSSNHVRNFLDKDDYIIQVWTTGLDPQIKQLADQGYRLIMSNYDALYFDCGYGAWVGEGNNWCSPYIGWQKVYENGLTRIGENQGLNSSTIKQQILGGEAALWTEQVDSATLDGRLWPRAAALAETLWSAPTSSWKDAETRILNMRERLVRMGIQAESLEPEWCLQNDGDCPRDFVILGLELIKKLTEGNVNPNKIPKMKVKYATQVFNRMVATNIKPTLDTYQKRELC